MIKDAIAILTKKRDLSFDETRAVFDEILSGTATPAQMAAFLVALRFKGETETEVFAAATAVRERSIKIKVRGGLLGVEDSSEAVLDTCSTGGSGINKFNVSTAAAIVTAACGLKVAKHGNRAMSGSCGSADVLEDLGVKIQAKPEVMEAAARQTGICFMYAPLYHPAFKNVGPVRKEIGIKTIFNILGPLCNPAQASHQLLGVYAAELVEIMAKVLRDLGVKKALVVCGKDVFDEVSLSGPTKAVLVQGKKLVKMTLRPADFGLKKISSLKVRSQGRPDNSRLMVELLEGKKSPYRDMVIASASCCLWLAGKAHDLKTGAKIAAAAIDEGKALAKLEEFRDFLNKQSV